MTLRVTSNVAILIFPDLPRGDVTALSHEGAEGEPQAVEYAKLVCRFISLDLAVLILLSVPLVRAEAAHEEKHHTDADVGKNDTHPDFISQRIQEREHSRFGFLRLLDHDGDSQRHERFREVNHFLSDQCDGQRGHCDVCFLSNHRTKMAAN